MSNETDKDEKKDKDEKDHGTVNLVNGRDDSQQSDEDKVVVVESTECDCDVCQSDGPGVCADALADIIKSLGGMDEN